MSEYKLRQVARLCDNNHMEVATVTAPFSVGYPFANALDATKRNKTYRPGINSFTIEIDLGSAKQFSFIGIFGKSNAAFGISDQATITLKASMINLFTGGEPYTKVVPVTDKGAFADLTDTVNQTGQQYRFVQLVINDSTNPDPIEIAFIYLGDHTSFTFNMNNGFDFRKIDLSKRSRSDAGVIYSNRKNQYNAFAGIGFSFLPTVDRRNLILAAERLGLTEPFILVLDPQEIVFDLEFGVLLCYFDEQPKLTHVYQDKFNLAFTVSEVV